MSWFDWMWARKLPTLTVSVDPNNMDTAVRVDWARGNTPKQVAGFLAMLLSGFLDEELVEAVLAGPEKRVGREAAELFLDYLSRFRAKRDVPLVPPMEAFQ